MKGIKKMFLKARKFEELNDASENCINALNNKHLLTQKQVLKLFRNINNQLIKNNIVNDYFTFNNYWNKIKKNNYEYHHVVLCENNYKQSRGYDENYRHYDDDRPEFYNRYQKTATVYRLYFYKKESIKGFLIDSLKNNYKNKEECLIVKNILLKTKLINTRSLKHV